MSVHQLWAHTPNQAGQWHSLEEHLLGTAERAQAFASAINPEAASLAYFAGLWHDLGKCSPRFQQYLQDQASGSGRKGEGGDHKGAGAMYARAASQGLPFLVAGHHGGLPSLSDLKGKLSEWSAPTSHTHEALAEARASLGSLLIQPGPLPMPGSIRTPLDTELFLRLLFSCLVDADFLDTEAHFDPHRTAERAPAAPGLDALWDTFSASQESLITSSGEGSGSSVNQLRADIYRAALERASDPTGFFRLTVPTGGGKTRTGLGFGLRHALAHDLRRVIFAVPYTTITEQTATTYRAIFASTPNVVLEHHSAVAQHDPAEDAAHGAIWRRLAAENWDAPIIVTTTVQLFESLLGHGPSACRKLHNVVGSVIVLDEAQTLPPHLLTPLLDVLRALVTQYRCSVVFCTATQPAFEAIRGFELIRDAREIAPDPPALFAALRRVTYVWPDRGETSDWHDVARRMRAAEHALAIVNTKKDALALLDALDDPRALHLSTLLCGAHRRDILGTIRARLAVGEPCRVVSTQVVEAGVDLDFPLVLRAFGPLDSIVQAAGRCNREGRLGEGGGRLIVFETEERRLPSGTYTVATTTAATLLASGAPDVDDPETFARFFRLFYGVVNTDARGVQSLRQALDFPETARKARLIEDDTIPAVVRYRGPNGDDPRVDGLLARLRGVPQPSRLVLRALQPFVVNLRRREAVGWESQGLMKEVVPDLGLWEWLGGYDRVRGIQTTLDPDMYIV